MSDNDQINVYDVNFITNAIFRVDIPKIDMNNSDPPEELRKELEQKFPIYHQIKKSNFGVKVEDKNQVTTQLSEKILWEFKSKRDHNKFNKVVISPDYISLEYEDYKTFKDFFKDIKFVFNILFEHYPIENVNRIGLRYINEISLDSGNPFDWNNLIDKSLFAVPEKFSKSSEDILRSMQVLDIEEDDYLLRFQFGLYNSEYPNPIARKEFVLDYDCFIKGEIEQYEIFKHAERCNKVISKWFEKSIEDGLREIMGVQKNES